MRWHRVVLLCLVPVLLGAAPSRTKTYTAGAVISPTDVTENEDNMFAYLQAGVDTLRTNAVTTTSILDGTITNADIDSAAAISSSKLALNGVVLPSGAVFYMLTGSCPSGTTDVSATYSNLFLRVNATAGSTGGADAHTHAAGSFAGPSHTHTIDGPFSTSAGNLYFDETQTGSGTITTSERASTTADVGTKTPLRGTTSASGTGAVTGTSGSTSNVPSFVTAKLCQVS